MFRKIKKKIKRFLHGPIYVNVKAVEKGHLLEGKSALITGGVEV